MFSIRHFYTKHTKAVNRIGPHSKSLLSVLVGNLLGDGWGEKRLSASRFHIHMSSRNVDYLYWLHKFYSQKGYCSPERPRVLTQVGKKNRVYYSLKFRTYSFSSLNWLYDEFYVNGVKRVPKCIGNLLDERALAIWFMDDGSKCGKGVLICTDSFSLEDVKLLKQVVSTNFKLKVTLRYHCNKWRLYFPSSEMPRFNQLIKHHMVPSMYYKLNE